MEAMLINSTTVYLKWKPPALATLNGEPQGFKVEIKANSTDGRTETITVGTAPTLLLGNLVAGISYTVRVAAYTRAGVGPFSTAALLRLDPASKVIDHRQKYVR